MHTSYIDCHQRLTDFVQALKRRTFWPLDLLQLLRTELCNVLVLKSLMTIEKHSNEAILDYNYARFTINSPFPIIKQMSN